VAGGGGRVTTGGNGPGPAITRPEEDALFFFFLGADTHFRAIRFPNTTRASPSCLLVP